jgi:HEPN domain-containing protein
MSDNYIDWLDFAEKDLRNAKSIIKDDVLTMSVLCAHDSAEKSLKCYLVLKKEQVDYSHNLIKLVKKCQLHNDAFESLLLIVEQINHWEERISYPDAKGGSFEPTHWHREKAIEVADEVLVFVKTQLN